MHYDLLLNLAMSVAALSGPQDAGNQATQTSGQQSSEIVVTAEKLKPAKKVCRSMGQTGSLMQKRTCRSVEEWQRETERSVVAMNRMRDIQRQRSNVQTQVEIAKSNP